MQTTLTTKQEHKAWTNGIAYHTVYGAGATPLKQDCTHALCVPSFMCSCSLVTCCSLLFRTPFQGYPPESDGVGCLQMHARSRRPARQRRAIKAYMLVKLFRSRWALRAQHPTLAKVKALLDLLWP